MLDNLPAETTQLLVDLCTTTGPLVVESDEPNGEGPPSAAVEEKAAASYLSYLALGRSGATAGESQQPPASPSTVRAARQEPSRDSVYNLNLASPSRPGTPSTVGPNAGAGSGRGAGGKPSAHTRAATIGHSRSATGVGAQQTPPLQQRRKLSPRLYFALFVDHLEQFVVFLETVAARRWGQTADEDGVKVAPPPVFSQSPTTTAGAGGGALDPEEELDESIEKADQIAVWNTLLELYLTLPAEDHRAHCIPVPPSRQQPTPPNPSASTLQASVLRKKAINVLKSDAIPYDPTHALILCSGHGYTDGLVLLWERLGMYEDVIRFWMDKARSQAAPDASDASNRVVEHLKRYGPSQPRLYLLVLRFLTSSAELLTRHQADVGDVIEYVDKQGILTPVGIIQVLSRNNVASVGLVKEWLGTRINDAKDEIQNVRFFVFCVFAVLHIFFFFFLLMVLLWPWLGPRPHKVVPRRNDDEAAPGARSFKPRAASRVPRHAMLGVQRAARLAEHPLYVRPQLSSTVRVALVSYIFVPNDGVQVFGRV